MPYKSDAQRRYMHAKHPEIAAKWDAEIRRKKVAKAEKPLMSDAELRRRKKLQGHISRTTSTLGLTGVGLLGTSLALKKKPGLLKAVPGLKKANPDKLREGAQNIGLVSGGIGGVGGYNFAAYTNAESRKRQKVAKSMDEMAPTYGVVGFAKQWEPVARKYDPEANRRKRAETYPKLATGVSAAAGAGAAASAGAGADKLLRSRVVRPKGLVGPMTRGQASWAKGQGTVLRTAGRKNLKTAAALGLSSAAAAAGSKHLKHKRDSASWASYSKSATSAFGVLHD